MSGNVNIRNLTGNQGGELVRGPRTVTGDFQAIQALSESVLGSVTCNIDQSTDSFGNQTLATGVIIYGSYSSVTVNSGTVILYNR